MFNKTFAIKNKFSLISYPDGNFWVRYIEGGDFYQVSEDGTKIQYYDGEVFDIGFEQLVSELESRF